MQGTRQAVVEAGFKQIACIPLTTHGEVVGVLTIATRSRKTISQSELQLLVSVAAGAGTAIENARLHSNVRRLAVLEERERIGMDLHDGIIQSIYGVGSGAGKCTHHCCGKIQMMAEERLQKAMEDLNHTIRDIRSYILDLRPRQLQGESLIEGLGRLISEFQQNTKVGSKPGSTKGSSDLTCRRCMPCPFSTFARKHWQISPNMPKHPR